MPFIQDILSYKSISIVGLEKNTGKTETLNYILQRLNILNKKVAITSIGIDGESTDQVTNTSKPKIELYEGTVFVTSEQYFLSKKLTAEVLYLPAIMTATGRLVIGRAVNNGEIILSGPPDTVSVKLIIDKLSLYDVDVTLVDGALSRMSLASPAITEAMILATGAAVSANINVLVQKTKFIKELIDLEAVEEPLNSKLQCLDGGVWAIDDNLTVHNLNIPSVYLIDKIKGDIFRFGHRFYVSGAISDRLLDFFMTQKEPSELIVKDFTKVFVSPERLAAFMRRRGKLRCLLTTKLIAVTINPTSPSGVRLNSDKLRETMENTLNIPVLDVRNISI